MYSMQTYENELMELHRHTIWQANKKYIDEHNSNADKFGYTLGMNEFGDLVSWCTKTRGGGYRRDGMGGELFCCFF